MVKIVILNWIALANANAVNDSNRATMNERYHCGSDIWDKKKDYYDSITNHGECYNPDAAVRGWSRNDHHSENNYDKMRQHFCLASCNPIVQLAFRFGIAYGHANLFPLTVSDRMLYLTPIYNESWEDAKFSFYNYIKAMELSEEWNRKTQDHFIAPVSWICDQDIAERKGSVYDIGERFPIDYTRIAHTTSTGRVRVQAVNDEIVFSFHSPSFKDGNESYANLTFFGNALHIEVVRGFELTPSRLQPFIDVLCLLNFSPKNALAFLGQYRAFGKAVKAYNARELEFEIARRVDNAIAQSCGNHYLAYHNDEMTIVQVMEDATTHIQWYNKKKLDNRLREVLALRIEQARNRKPRVYHMED